MDTSEVRNIPAVEMRDITKVFGRVRANDKAQLTLYAGEIHAILGENGAGKTTLMNILYGLYQPSSGKILVRGNQVRFSGPNDAIAAGIGMVHQHFMLIPPFSVVENIILGMEPLQGIGRIDIKTAARQVEELSRQYGLHVDVNAKIQNISVGMQQRVEILKALYRGADILILDEPTAALTPQEITELSSILKGLAQEGKTVVIITHKLKEIKAMAHRCTIMRQGKYVGTVDVNAVSTQDMAAMMVGRQVEFTTKKGPFRPGKDILRIRGLHARDYRGVEILKGLDLSVRQGEIVGLAGIDGNGQTELAEILSGLRKADSGSITICGADAFNKTPDVLFSLGASSIPEDRQKYGLILDLSVSQNLVIQNIGKEPFSRRGRLCPKAIGAYAKEQILQFDIRPQDCENRPARQLSGGNQQKIIVAREVQNNKELLIAVNPTRGLDVGAIEYVHRYLAAHRDQGKAVLLISFELDEIMDLADTIQVIYDGKITGGMSSDMADEKQLGLMMAGGDQA